MARSTVKVIDSSGSEVDKATIRNPRKEANEILERLSEAGYKASLPNAGCDSRSSNDQDRDLQEHRLVLPALSFPGMHCLWQSWSRAITPACISTTAVYEVSVWEKAGFSFLAITFGCCG